MPRFPRLRLKADFRAAILADPRGIVRLSALAGFPAYPTFSELVRASHMRGTPLIRARFTQLAEAMNYTGRVFHD